MIKRQVIAGALAVGAVLSVATSAVKPPAIPLTTSEAFFNEVPATRPFQTTKAKAKSRFFVCEITAYCACAKCCGKTDGITASGRKVKQGVTVAADWKVFPKFTKLLIHLPQFEGMVFEVQDVGGGVKGNRIDVYFDSHQDALNFGRRRNIIVEVLK